MRILITGGFGYIGGRLAQHLHNEGHQIIIGSRNITNQRNWLPQVKIVLTDWNDSFALEKICKGADVVIHTAGMNAQDCDADPVKALEFNGLATARLVSAASRVGVKRFIYLSTTHVYSSPLMGDISELTCPGNINPYSASHLAGEDAVLNANQRGEIEGIVFRLSNAFGAPMDMNVNCWMLLVNDLCQQTVKTEKIILSSSGIQQRNFITLHNIGRAVSHFLTLQKKSLLDGLFNIGGDYSMSVFDMAKNVARCSRVELGFEPKIEKTKLKQGEKIIELQYNTSKLKSTGFVLEDNMDEEIIQTLKICKKK
jgi:UDP-glucose 4-epimerase